MCGRLGGAPRPDGSAIALLAELLDAPPQAGTVTWLGVRPARRGDVVAVDHVRAVAGRGLEGDHRATRTSTRGRREVTLVQAEHLPVVAALAGAPVTPEATRRNVVVAGFNLLALKGRRFRLGSAVLEGTGPCHPCSRMETTIGPGAHHAMRGHGGVTAVVLHDGDVHVGDGLVLLPPEADDTDPPAAHHAAPDDVDDLGPPGRAASSD